MAASAPAGRARPGWPQVRATVVTAAILALACLAAYWLVIEGLSRVYSGSAQDGTIGGLWAMISAIFVYRDSHEHSLAAALSRISATGVSFVLCLAYLLILPPSPAGMGVLIALGAITVMLAGRPGDSGTTSIATAVVMVSAILHPHDAWRQPVLRLADTIVGVAIGLTAAWLGLRAAQLAGAPPGSAGSEPRRH